MKVLVLGSGPAGLMAAQGVYDAHQAGSREDLSMMIVSLGKKSELYGAQYLHEPIPNITPREDSVVIGYRLQGSSEDYRRKVYGRNWGGTVSPEDLEEEHRAWDIRLTYDILWDRWGHAVTVGNIDPLRLSSYINLPDGDQPDLIISSIPRTLLCHAGHTFGAIEVWAAGDAPELGIYIPYKCPRNMVVCNGEDSPSWYRISNVFGRTTVEWPGEIADVPVNTAARVRKPTHTDCDCWADSPVPVVFVGRYGTWEKGVLSHSAYQKAYDQMERWSSAEAEAEA